MVMMTMSTIRNMTMTITMIMMTMSMSMARNGTFVPLEQETGSSAKYTASGFIPDHPGYIAWELEIRRHENMRNLRYEDRQGKIQVGSYQTIVRPWGTWDMIWGLGWVHSIRPSWLYCMRIWGGSVWIWFWKGSWWVLTGQSWLNCVKIWGPEDMWTWGHGEGVMIPRHLVQGHGIHMDTYHVTMGIECTWVHIMWFSGYIRSIAKCSELSPGRDCTEAIADIFW